MEIQRDDLVEFEKQAGLVILTSQESETLNADQLACAFLDAASAAAIVNRSSVKLLDRPLLAGQLVQKEKGGVYGILVSTSLSLEVSNPFAEPDHVMLDNVQNVHKLSTGTFVFSSDFQHFGVVSLVEDKVIVMFGDGSLAVCSPEDVCAVESVPPDSVLASARLYPGCLVTSDWTEVQWIGSPGKHLETAIVVNVTQSRCLVKWIVSKGFISSGKVADLPSEQDELVPVQNKLTHPLQLGDKLILTAHPTPTSCWTVTKTQTSAEIHWQDGTFESNCPATQLTSVDVDPDSMWPLDWVADGDDRVGIVKSVQDWRVCVQWMDGREVEQSVFDVWTRKEWRYRAGDFVVILPPPADSQPTDSQPTDSQPTDSQPTDSQPTESQPTDSQPTADWIGQVVSASTLEEKRLSVLICGKVCLLYPWQIIMIPVPPLEDSIDSDVEDAEAHENHGTEMWESEDDLIDILSISLDTDDDESTGETDGDDVEVESTISSAVSRKYAYLALAKSFPGFTVSKSPPEYFLDTELTSLAPMRRLHSEYQALEQLPMSILVRSFPFDRPDVLSVLMIGPAATIYEGAVFLLDVLLPSNYPNAPPWIHLRHPKSVARYGSVHPSFAEDGSLCMWMLNEWNPTWNVAKVLIVVHALILGEERHVDFVDVDGERRWLLANESLFQTSEVWKEELAGYVSANRDRFLENWRSVLSRDAAETPTDLPTDEDAPRCVSQAARPILAQQIARLEQL